MPGVFQFSHYTKTEEGVIEWYNWFRNRRVPAAIVRRDIDGEARYSVWRACAGTNTSPHKLGPYDTVVVQANGFMEHAMWKKHGGNNARGDGYGEDERER